MKAAILCGGLGTRIRDANETLPKAMLPIGGKPILWHIMKSFETHNVREFVLCLGYKGWLIREFFLNYRAMTSDFTLSVRGESAAQFHDVAAEDWLVTLAETGEATMTGGRVAAIRRYVEQDDLFLLTYGDGVADLDIKSLIAFHRNHGQIATVTAVRPPGRFGEMRLDGTRVAEFNEKPQTSEGFINGGFFVLDAKRVWPYIGEDPQTVFEREPLQRLAAAGELRAYPHEGFWQPMDTAREYQLLNDLWTSGKAPWARWRAVADR